MKKLDSIDKRILETMQSNGRISNVELAKKIHLSPTPCLDRVKRLERDGYIVGYRAILSPDRLQCGFVTFMNVCLDRTSEDVFDKFARNVATLEEVVECHMVGGGFDYILKIRTESMTAFRMFMAKKLSILPEVMQTHSYFSMEEVKDSQTLTIR